LQHEEREHIVDSLVKRLLNDLTPKALEKISKNPYEPYNPDVILDLMGTYAIQRRTAKEWLICAQIRVANRKV